MTTPVKIPERSLYKAVEVCAIAKLQPYVLRSWEAEFPDLGLEQPGSRLRLYRRAHLDMVLHIKELLFVEGLTLGAARRKILQEAPEQGESPPLDELLGADARARVEDVKEGLRSILAMLSTTGNGNGLLPLDAEVEDAGNNAASVALSGTQVLRKTTRARRAVKTSGTRRTKV